MGKRLKKIKAAERSIEIAIAAEVNLKKTAICSKSFCVRSATTVGIVLFYYCFSIPLTFYNQRFIHTYRFPLSITMTHLVTKFVLSMLVRSCLECISKTPRVTLSWYDYVKRVAPPGIASSLDIGLSNWSFEFITVSLYTMTKSTVIIFILFFSVVFKLEKPRCSLLFVVLFISVGLFMFSYESTQFHTLGFLLALSASFLSGLRWTLSQLVLQKNEIGLSNPLDMMYHIQPWMILALLPLSAPMEGLHVATSNVTFGFESGSELGKHMGILMIGALLAFGLELSEFLLVRCTSSLTLSVSGILKEILILFLATLINGDSLNLLNGTGLAICILGIILHVLIKIFQGDSKEDSANEVSVKRLDDSIELLTKNGQANALTDSEEEVEVFNIRRDR